MSTFEVDWKGPSILVTAAELAEMLRVSKRTLWRQVSARQVPQPVRIGAAVRWRLEEIKKWIADGCPTPERRENGKRTK
jgi:predicted DNA-binding transcriptional regulator AlpA